MDRWVTLVGIFVVTVILGAGPLTGVDVTSASEQSFGDGDAAVTDVTVDRSELALTPGRFGTNVTYLRVPPATVTVESVTDRPRLLYIVSVPALDVELVESKVVTGPGSYRLAPDDRVVSADRLSDPSTATLSVRVQSFTTDRTLTSTNATVGGST